MTYSNIHCFYQKTCEPGTKQAAAAGEHPSLRPDTVLHLGAGLLVTVAALNLHRLLSKHVRVQEWHGNLGLHFLHFLHIVSDARGSKYVNE